MKEIGSDVLTSKKKESGWLGTILWTVAIIAVVVLLRTFVFSPVVISGHSMDPTLQNGERVISVKTAKVKRFDIVTLQAPDNPNEEYVKRVIGLPGDTVEVKNDQLYINGRRYDEPYLDEYKQKLKNGTLASEYESDYQSTVTSAKTFTNNFSLKTLDSTDGKTKVPEGYYFVLGDNRLISKDSRYFGFVKASAIDGVVEFAFWPLKDFGPIKSNGE